VDVDTAMQARDHSRTRQPLFSVRKRLFMASLLFAFLFPLVTWKQAAGCAFLLLLFDALILPWLGIGATRRTGLAPGVGTSTLGLSQPPPSPLLNKGGGPFVPVGHTDLILILDKRITLYTVSVLALILIYRNHLHIAAAAWAIMALGDGMASVVGEAVRGSALPSNQQVSWPQSWRCKIAAPSWWRGKLAATLPWNRE